MKADHKLALAALAGIAIGVAGAGAIHAQQSQGPPAYVIAEVVAPDPTALKGYAEKAPGTLAPFNGRYVIRGGKPQALEGEAPKSIVVIAFDSAEKARGWYESPAYEAIKPIRQRASTGRLFIAEGVAPQ